MKPHLDPNTIFFIITFILTIFIHLPSIWSQQTQPYDVCGQTVQCGNNKLEYPFYGLGRPDYCGHPGFQLTCSSNVTVLNHQSVNYRVLNIDTGKQIINIARNDLWNSICPQYLYNTTYNTNLFNDDNLNQVNVSLYYGCNTSASVTQPSGENYNNCTGNSTTLTTNNPNQVNTSVYYACNASTSVVFQPLSENYKFSCIGNSTTSDSYFLTTNSTVNFLMQCDSHIDVPVSQSSANQLGSVTATTGDLTSALTAGFNLQWTANNDECDQCIRSNGRCGSNSTTPELFVCYCANGIFSLTCDNKSVNGENKRAAQKLKLLIGLSSGFVGIILILLVIHCYKKRKHRIPKRRNQNLEIFIRNYGSLAPKRFKYSEIKKMTNSFHEKLGQGGYGSVYKGQLPDGQLVAVKLLNEAMGDGEDFINEVASIGRTSHVNIVTLLGFCIEGKKRALMYEFMPNGSLDRFIRGDDSHLDWNTLFLIAKGIARGLEYLHRGCNTRIVHFDIKPHNILLDEEFVPKISDFGLAKLCKRKESIVSVMGARGTAGYMAPEVFFSSFGGASHKSDVYSYGMMVLEMTGARKNKQVNLTSTSEAYFPESIYNQVESGDSLGVDGVTTKEEEELAKTLVTVSLWCIQYDPSVRPAISKVLEMMEGGFETLQVPPKHFWSSPTKPDQGIFPSATQSSADDRVSTVQSVGEIVHMH